ncbi:LuxR C-terminal-related transcriptional regulator [Azospirillum canadense]|uniref:LuxR C-terminal-related transcriptional regulator n=1 Tax=Azospirillum canadense TaxID=403962 RepID=UPI002225F595|nr:response regulator transcription factor [Azospirillum canadense]MCW2242414.1 two-component system nitrate/nitrite response regulator NarL [Azospirillum canadense]
MHPVSIFLIDANKLFREGMKALFSDGEFRVTNEAANAEGMLSGAEGEAPQLIMLDPASTRDTVQAVTALKGRFPEARLVLLATELDTTEMANAIQAGADAFLMKDISPAALAQSLRLVMMGEKVFPTHLAALLIAGKVNANANGPSMPKGLSGREVQLVQRLLLGDSNKMIAIHLNITEATVKVHLKSLLRKINVSNRTQAAIWALENGFGSKVEGTTLEVA